jgi:hypothetical protein
LGLNFNQPVYEVSPGDTVELRVAFAAPVPNGLDAYGLRLTYPAGSLMLTAADIAIVPALNHDLFAQGAASRHVTTGAATIQGFADFAAGPYMGTAVVTFRVTVPSAAPAGNYTLQLGLADPGGNNFVNGNMQVIDNTISFGSATLVVNGSGGALLRFTEITRTAQTGHVRLRLSGSPGGSYTIQASTNLSTWNNLATMTAAPDGSFEYTDANAGQFLRRFYRSKSD